jgi:hypothetical protein
MSRFCSHRGAVLAPPIRVHHPLRTAADLFRSRWFAIGWIVAIFAWIGLTGAGANHPQRASMAALITVECATFALGAALVRISTRRHVLDRAEGLLLGAAAGALFGASDVAIKYLTKTPPGPLGGFLSPWALTALTGEHRSGFRRPRG